MWQAIKCAFGFHDWYWSGRLTRQCPHCRKAHTAIGDGVWK